MRREDSAGSKGSGRADEPRQAGYPDKKRPLPGRAAQEPRGDDVLGAAQPMASRSR